LISKALTELLNSLNLLDSSSVFFTGTEPGALDAVLNLDIRNKLEIISPEAFFVFNKHPFVLFFDLTTNDFPEREQQIHRQVWSFDYAPLIFIVKGDEVQLFNAFNYDKQKERLEYIKLDDSDRNALFSFWSLQTGESWKWLQTNYYKGNNIQKKRVNQRLFDNIREVRQKLSDSTKNIDGVLSEDDANILILRLIFIRYLIDRNVQIPTEYITGDTLIERRASFSKLIADQNQLDKFFVFLNDRFNGVLFRDANIHLSPIQANSVSLIFDGRKDKSTPSLFDNLSEFYFDIFDFSIIPVEIISGIYESLINDETKLQQSAVYTPSFLVEYILGDTVDRYLQNEKTSECRIFDPSCGSGIFLVQAYRRMVDAEKHLHGDKISKVRLRELAEKNLFGIDLNQQALKVSCFSIYIAMLDYQDPKTIIDNFKFPVLLSENLFCADYFDTSHDFNNTIKSKKLQFILGNPPWKSNKDEQHLAWLKVNKKVTGRFEIAQSFLLRTKDFMQPQTSVALIVTSTIFYNISKTNRAFKSEFLTNYCLTKFFDLSPVRRLVFEEKSNPAAIVYFRLSDVENCSDNVVEHISVKSNIFLKYFKTLVVEKYDQKRIQQKHFIENDWMFKVALYGNTLDFLFLKRLEKFGLKISDLIDDKEIFKGAGIERGSDAKPFLQLEGLPILENSEVKKYYSPINHQKKLTASDTVLSRGRRLEVFQGLKILFKEQNQDESDPLISFVDETAVFRKGIYSIASETQPETIKQIYAYAISQLYLYFIFIKSCGWGVSTRPQIRLDEEYLSFPFLKSDQKTISELIRLVDVFLSPCKEHFSSFHLGNMPVDNESLKTINLLVEEIYQVKDYEHDLIDYVLQVSRYQFQESRQHLFAKKVDRDENLLRNYAAHFFKEFDDLYEEELLTIEVYALDYFIAFNFKFTKDKNLSKNTVTFKRENDDVKTILNMLAKGLSITSLTNLEDSNKNLFIQKDIKGFEKDSFYIIKPNEYKCWHPAMAWYDVAEIKNIIEQTELKSLAEGQTNGW